MERGVLRFGIGGVMNVAGGATSSRLDATAGSGRAITIGLLFHSLNSGNLGVGALTVANIAIAREVAEGLGLAPRFVVMAMRDADTPSLPIPDTEVFAIDRKAMTSPAGFWRAIGAVDCVLDIGAGDSFADIYGPKRFSFLWLTKIMAAMRGTPLIFSPQTIGPFTKAAYRIPAAYALKRAEVVFARDALSRDIARRMAPAARVEMAVDVAFVLPFTDRSAERGGATRRIGINASGLLFHEAETGRNRFGLSYDYAAFTRQLLRELSARQDVEIHLVPHATSNRDRSDDDGALADQLAAEFPGAIRVPNFTDPSAAKSYISSLDLLVAARMHACIGAFSAGTPVLPVAYSRKFTGLFGLLDYDMMVPVTGLDEAGAVALAMRALEDRAALAAREAAGMRKVEALLDVYRGALRTLFAAVGRAA
jgi:colanic acid/amylovoran biosynthesis protein